MQEQSQIETMRHLTELEYKQTQLFIRQEDIKNRLLDLLVQKEGKFELMKKIFDAKGYYLSTKKRENNIAHLKEAKATIDESVKRMNIEIQRCKKLIENDNLNNGDESLLDEKESIAHFM